MKSCLQLKVKLRKLNELENVERFKETIEGSYRGEDEEGETEVIWNQFKAKISDAADRILGEKKSYEGKKKMTPWWTIEVKDPTGRGGGVRRGWGWNMLPSTPVAAKKTSGSRRKTRRSRRPPS